MVLALLVLFGLIGIAFVVLTGHSQRSARSVERIGLVADPPKQALEQAFMQVARGPMAPTFFFSGGAGGSPATFARGDTVTDTDSIPPATGIITDVTDNGATGSMAIAVTATTASSDFDVTHRIMGSSGKTATIASIDNPASVMGAHSLLEDIYGNRSVAGHIVTATAACGGELVELITDVPTPEMARHIGCVLTITGNYNTSTFQPNPAVAVPDNLQSTRIVATRIVPNRIWAAGQAYLVGDIVRPTDLTAKWPHYYRCITAGNSGGVEPVWPNGGTVPDGSVAWQDVSLVQIEAFPDGASLNPTGNTQVAFTVNGAPFSGTGFGYDTTMGTLNATTLVTGAGMPCPLALLPNETVVNRNPPGGANSDYTAADFQHMLLAAQAYNPATMKVDTEPSLHRPALINYWINQVVPPAAATISMPAGTSTVQPSFTVAAAAPVTLDLPAYTTVTLRATDTATLPMNTWLSTLGVVTLPVNTQFTLGPGAVLTLPAGTVYDEPPPGAPVTLASATTLTLLAGTAITTLPAATPIPSGATLRLDANTTFPPLPPGSPNTTFKLLANTNVALPSGTIVVPPTATGVPVGVGFPANTDIILSAGTSIILPASSSFTVQSAVAWFRLSTGRQRYVLNDIVTPPSGKPLIVLSPWRDLWDRSRDLCRSISLRPIGAEVAGGANPPDHLNFTGSNPDYDPAVGPADIDNDGDGKPDSLWVDLGFPVRSTTDGRQYKPLFAILCTDLDGRLNLNAHGSLAQTDARYAQTFALPAATNVALVSDTLVTSSGTPMTLPAGVQVLVPAPPPAVQILLPPGTTAITSPPTAVTLTSGSAIMFQFDTAAIYSGNSITLLSGTLAALQANITATLVSSTNVTFPVGAPTLLPQDAQLPFGQGFGPADVNLSYILRPAALPTTELLQILAGGTIGGVVYEGRCGQSLVPGINALDPRNRNRWFEYALGVNGAYWTFTNVNNAGAYGSPPDPFGAGVVGLDQAGRPLYGGVDYGGIPANYVGFGSGTLNNPYELDLGATAARGTSTPALVTGKPNNPFSAAELERVLRPYDYDVASLPDRLATLAPSLVPSATNIDKHKRMRATTDSWDVPCPNAVSPATLSAAERLRLPSTGGRVTHITDLLTARGIPANVWPDLLPPEVLAGQKMNINRSFGNGLDDNGNNVVDESQPDESLPAQGLDDVIVYNGPMTSTALGVRYNESATCATSLAARQLEARYLYVLLCLTSDLTYLNGQLGSSANTAQFLAQWAVNVVDFKARDAIMTPFDYDPTFAVPGGPIAGWSPTTRVWGCKRPELLIAETLAIHDRRTEDLATDTTGGPVPAHDMANGDPDVDQVFRPQGSLFVELYNPSSPLQPRSGDLYTASNGNLDITAITPAGAGVQYPVWRMIIATPTPSIGAPNPEQPDPDDPTGGMTTVERLVYFVSTLSATLPNDYAVPASAVFRPAITTPTTIAPGHYLVIGPSEQNPAYQTTGGTPHPRRTYISFRAGFAVGDDSTRYVELDPTWVNALAVPMPVQNNTNSPADPNPANVNTPELLAIDTPHRLNISEPLTPASALDYDGMEAAASQFPNNDGQYGTAVDTPFDIQRTDGNGIYMNTSGRTPVYRVMYLQRLANPLQPYNSATNPYRTVDQAAVDLFAFNGLVGDTVNFMEARQRGENNDVITTGLNTNMDLWKQEPVSKSAWDITFRSQVNQNYQNGLKHSLGYLSQPFGSPAVIGTGEKGMPSSPFPWVTWNNRPFASPFEAFLVPTTRSSKLLVNAGNSIADPNYFNYFRIIASGATTQPYEPGATVPLLPNTLANSNVPYTHLLNFFQSSQSSMTGSPQFHRILDYLEAPSPFTGTETDTPVAAWQGGRAYKFGAIVTPVAPAAYSYHSYRCIVPGVSDSAEPGWPPLPGGIVVDNSVTWQDIGAVWQASTYYAVGQVVTPSASPNGRSYVCVAAGTSDGATEPAWTTGGLPVNDAAPLIWQEYDYGFHPPFNRLSAYREPGRVNLNTIHDPSVLAALTNGPSGPSWADFQRSRQGYDGAGLNALYPTQFARPFRSYAGGSMVPGFFVPTLVPSREINATLLREQREGAATPVPPLFNFASTQPYNHTDRNPFFRYQGLERLGNLVTTRSNVYAVWITVGYFEVSPNSSGIDAGRPDGYQLGRELGSDTGEIERHRAFYIFDRTIPVGFQRGRDLNVRKAILVERYIE